jgi:transcriptional regulator with XRE-family HTH domain
MKYNLLAGRRLRLARERYGLTRGELVDKQEWQDIVKVFDIATIGRWERKGIPTDVKISRVAKFFKVDIHLFTDPDIEESAFINTIVQNTEILDKTLTEKIIKLHQASAAFRISRVIDRNIKLIAEDRDAFDSEIFIREIRAELLKSRELCSGFVSKHLGDLGEYFENTFPASELKNQVESLLPKLLNVGDSIARRQKLFDIIRIIQTEVFKRIIADLNRDPEVSEFMSQKLE